MANIDDAVDFFTSFFDAEFKVRAANLAGASELDQLHTELSSMLAEPTVFEIRRIEKLTGIAIENTKKELAPRQLFLVEQHEIGKRKVYCAYVGDPRRAKNVTRYAMAFWADDSLRIVATYLVCSTCDGLGKSADGSECSECNWSTGWLRKTGDRELIRSRKPVAVKKLARPNWPQSAEHYDQR